VFLEDDLVDSVKPGDRVAITGIFRPLVGAAGGTYNGICRWGVCVWEGGGGRGGRGDQG
jgi:hypothetical protein